MAVFDFQDASIKGDPKWASATSWTGYAPIVVLTLAVLSIIQIVIGVVWITSIQSLSNNLTFAQVVQPLIIPGLSFFNTIPSLHLPIIFSSIMSMLYLASAIIFLPPCANGNSTYLTSSAYRRTECPIGSRRDLWAAQVALQFMSALLYATHIIMAAKVKSVVSRRDRDEREGRVLVVVDEEARAKREEEARRRWQEIRDL
jgi:hypothetical protein